MIVAQKLTKESPIFFNSIKEKIIHITTISLESTDDNFPIDIFCSNKKKKEVFKICSLKKNFTEIYSTSIVLDLHSLKDKYEFYLKTKCKKVIVNIIGFYEEEEEQEEYDNIPKNKNEQEKKKKKSDDESNSESDSDDDNIDNELNDNKPDVSLVDLLNKKRKEEPQDIKPITLKNLAEKNNEGNQIKKEIKEIKGNKDKIKDKNKENKMIQKDKKLFKNK